MPPLSPKELEALIHSELPDANVSIKLYSGNDHFEVNVISELFSGKSKIQRQRMVLSTLKNKINNEIHAITLTTSTPAELTSETK